MIRTYTGHTNIVRSIEFISAETISSGGYDQTIQIWSISSGQTQTTINVGVYVYSLKLLNNGIHLASGLGNGNINIYNVNTESLVATLNGDQQRKINDLVQISNSDLLASSNADNSVKIWNLTSNTLKFNMSGHYGAVVGLRQVSSNVLASAGSLDRVIILWDINLGQYIRTLYGHASYIYWSLDLLSNAQTLVS